MIIGQIGMQAYINTPLQNNSVNDISPTPKNPSNTGVDTTTGIFGQSNGAMEWDTATDKLAWSSSVGNEIATLISNSATITFFVRIRTLSFGNLAFIYGQFPFTAAQRSFGFLLSNDGSLANGTQLTIHNGTTADVFNTASNLSYNDWFFCSVKYVKNGSNVDTYLTINGNSSSDAGSVAIKLNSSSDFTIGARADNNTFGDFGKAMSFRVYPAELNSLQTQIINAQMGRIAA
jgi:hypothetical protein